MARFDQYGWWFLVGLSSCRAWFASIFRAEARAAIIETGYRSPFGVVGDEGGAADPIGPSR
jgi:hypothetical protein